VCACARVRVRGRARARARSLTATLPGGGPAEDGSELRSHACGVAKVEARGHASGVGRIVIVTVTSPIEGATGFLRLAWAAGSGLREALMLLTSGSGLSGRGRGGPPR
jgi:hypothetical protein